MTKFFYDCGICGCIHPCQFTGDCRDDANRFALDELNAQHGALNWECVEMDQADDFPDPRVQSTTSTTRG